MLVHLDALEKKNAIRRESKKARALVVTAGSAHTSILEIPIYGTIAAGMPEWKDPESEGCVAIDAHTIRIPRNARTFALRVQGDSMIGAGILEGDIVIMEFREPCSGNIVAALIDGETTLKRYLTHQGQPFLKAENSRYPDLIPAHELVIQGVQVALIRTSI